MADFADEKTHPRVPSASDYGADKEKHQSDESVRDAIHATDIDTNEHFTTGDPFPIDPLIPEEEYQLTVRAIVIGCALGAIVGASNIYLGLKTGFTFGPQLFGAIFGYAIIKPLSRAIGGNSLPGWLWGGNFGPKENVCVQTAATSAGGLGILFVSGVPAMYRLGLMSYTPDQDFGKLISLTIASCYFGVAFAIPLRKYFIIHQKLVFPTPTATAFTIRSLHDGVTGAIVARKKSLGLLISFAAVFTFKIATGYLPGIIYDWHIGWTLYRLGWNSIIALENYNWWIEFTPAFFGAGMLSGLNASWSFFGGCILAWGIIAPALVAQGIATTVSISDEYPLKSVNALKFATPDDYIHAASPRYHLLWPGVLIMLVYSFVELFMSSRSLMGGIGAGFGKLRARIDRFRNRNDPNIIQPDYIDSDPAPLEDRVPTWAWVGVLIVSIILAISLTSTQFSLGVGELILALLLSFLFSFIGVQSAGDTDINPVSTVAKASQLIFGGVSKGQGMEQMKAEKLNLVAGVVAAGAAAQATDMTGDFKTGHLLRAKPKVQFVAQIAGSTVASFLTVGLFVLFTKASPCILYPAEDGNCTYGAPSVAAWAAVATAVTSPTLPIPRVSGIIAICLAIAAAITVVVKHLFIPKKYWNWVPNWNAVGLGFVLPQTYYSTAMAAGSVFCWWWEHRSPVHFDMYMYPVSAGLLAGEGLGGVVQALLQVAGVAGDGVKYGTSVGCPGFEFCG